MHTDTGSEPRLEGAAFWEGHKQQKNRNECEDNFRVAIESHISRLSKSINARHRFNCRTFVAAL